MHDAEVRAHAFTKKQLSRLTSKHQHLEKPRASHVLKFNFAHFHLQSKQNSSLHRLRNTHQPNPRSTFDIILSFLDDLQLYCAFAGKYYLATSVGLKTVLVLAPLWRKTYLPSWRSSKSAEVGNLAFRNMPSFQTKLLTHPHPQLQNNQSFKPLETSSNSPQRPL